MWRFRYVCQRTEKYFNKRLKEKVIHRENHSTEKKLVINDYFAPQYCINLVEKNDYENYLCTLLLRKENRRYAFALRAFNVEVAKSASSTSDHMIAKMRLKFWSDSVDKCFDKNTSYVNDHPVLRELKYTVNTHELNKLHLKRLVTGRDRAQNEQFITLSQLEEYAEYAFSSLMYLLVQLSGIKDMHVDHTASHLGKAVGIATLLRAIPYQTRSQAINIPQDILIKNGVSQERLLRHSGDDKAVEDCVFEVASAAHQHLEKACSLADKVPKNIRSVFLPAIPTRRYLDRLRRANFRLSDQNCLQRDSMLPMSIYWHNLRSKF